MFNCCLCGPPGSGKTYMSTITLPPDCYPVVVVDIDNKARKMVVLEPLVKNGRVIILPTTKPLVADDMLTRISKIRKYKDVLVGSLSKKPEGYVQSVENINKAIEMTESGKAKTIVVDSLTRLFEHFQRLILNLNVSGFMTQNTWGVILTLGEELLQMLTSIEANVIITCHDRISRDELTGRVEYRPCLGGQIADKLGGYFEEMYVMQPRTRGDKIEYRVLTQAVGGMYTARTSRKLEMHEPSDFKVILGK